MDDEFEWESLKEENKRLRGFENAAEVVKRG
jgi:hypothetical protein